MKTHVALLCLLTLIPAGAFGASGAVYRWTDAQGVIHFTDSPENIPAEQRAAQEKPPAEAETSVRGAGAQPGTQTSAEQGIPGETKAKEEPAGAEAAPSEYAAPAPILTLDNFGRDETWWRDRRKFWDQRLADAQRLHHEARRELNRVNQRYDSREYKQMKLLRERMDTLEGEIARAQEMLGGGLAREARKAGAPPGWVR